jgi:hypothetical protein
MAEMPDDELRNAANAIVARLQADVDAHLAKLDEQHARARDDVRREAEAKAAADWAGRLDAERTDWQGRLEAALADARADADRRLTEETTRLRAQVEEAAAAHDRGLQEAVARVRAEVEQSAAQAVAQARAEVEQTATQAAARVRAEMEEAAAHSKAQFEEELQRTLAAERDRAGNELNSERARLLTELGGDRDRMASEVQAERLKAQAISTALEETRLAVTVAETETRAALTALEEVRAVLLSEREASRTATLQPTASDDAIAKVRAEERQSHLAFVERLLSAVRAIDTARSLSDTLSTLASAAATVAPRIALFVVNDRADAAGRDLQGWRAAGFGDPSPASLRLSADDAGLVGAAASLARPVSTQNAPAPAFASLRRDRAALAVPVLVGGKSVAVLYADDNTAEEPEAPASWPEAIQLLAAHASAWLTQITAVRTTQAMRASSATGMRPAGDDGSARRYARLLVSEIKLYNEVAVRSGREKRDLLRRLRPEIERARRLYEERVSPSVSDRAVYFQEELVHTLADGDEALLGSPS